MSACQLKTYQKGPVVWTGGAVACLFLCSMPYAPCPMLHAKDGCQMRRTVPFFDLSLDPDG